MTMFGDQLAQKKWSEVKTFTEAKALVDYGALLQSKDAKVLHKRLPIEDVAKLSGYLAINFSENNEVRLVDEILMESALSLLMHSPNEKPLQSFLESFLQHANFRTSVYKLVEMSLQNEATEADEAEDLLSMAVTLVCELGLAVDDLQYTYPKDFAGMSPVLDHVATFLLSVSNSSSEKIRLSLFYYFANVSHEQTHAFGFNKIVSRFGHTLIENLFNLLFQKKTEGVAFQFLLDNLPHLFRCDHNAQNIVHETMRFHMLKHPDRFGIFVEALGDEMAARIEKGVEFYVQENFFGHMGALLRVVSDIGHRPLVHTILQTLFSFEGNTVRNEIIYKLIQCADIKDMYRDILKKMLATTDISRADKARTEKIIDRLGERKRGRRPVFTSTASGMHGYAQIDELGGYFTKKKAS